MTLSNNILVASQPFVTQKAANVSTEKFWEYIYVQSRFMFYVMLLTGLPIYIYAEELLLVWLDVVPDNTVEFVRAIVVYSIVLSFQKSLDLSFKSYNKMSQYQIVDACIILLTIPVVYLALSYGAKLYYTFIIFSVVRIIDYIAILFIARVKIGLNIRSYTKNVILPAFIGGIIFIILTQISTKITEQNNLFLLFIYMVLTVIIALLLLYLFSFKEKEKMLIRLFCIHIINKMIKR